MDYFLIIPSAIIAIAIIVGVVIYRRKKARSNNSDTANTEQTDSSYASYNKYLEQSVQTRTLLGEWHDRQVKALRIDLNNGRVSKAGFEAVISAIPGLIDDKFNYKELKQSLAHEISTQANPTLGSSEAPKQVYDEDVTIIIKDGKYYYLPEASVTED